MKSRKALLSEGELLVLKDRDEVRKASKTRVDFALARTEPNTSSLR